MPRSILSLTKALRRELNHRAWLRKHLPNSVQARLSQRKIFKVRCELAKRLGCSPKQ
jgi:hypothetical protein